MAVLRFVCPSSVTHDDIVLEVPDEMVHAYGQRIEVFCPECNHEMDYVVAAGGKA